MDLVRKAYGFKPFKKILKDNIFFYVNETVVDFFESIPRQEQRIKNLDFLKYMPYNEMALVFNDTIISYIKEPKKFPSKNNDGSVIGVHINEIKSDQISKKHAKWFVGMCVLLEEETGVVGAMDQTAYKDGKFFGFRKDHQPAYMTEELEDAYTDILAARCIVLQQFISFLSCKNIRTVDSIYKHKYHGEKKKRSLFEYKELQLTTKGSVSKNGQPQNLWSNRVHLCRGHFREYTEEKPLFGKLIGRYWIPPHARGNKAEGVIHKSYKVEPANIIDKR